MLRFNPCDVKFDFLPVRIKSEQLPKLFLFCTGLYCSVNDPDLVGNLHTDLASGVLDLNPEDIAV